MVVTFDFIVSDVFVVAFSSYFTTVLSIRDVVSGSTISGLTDATLNFCNCVIILVFVVSVSVEPDAALMAIFTTP